MSLIKCDNESLYTFKKTRQRQLMLVPEIAKNVLLQEIPNYKAGIFISLC